MYEFPVSFYRNEYDRTLGLYQKWLHGDKTQQIEKLYSMSAFQSYDIVTESFIKMDNYHKYAEYLYESVSSIIKSDIDEQYHVRIYIDESILNPLNQDKDLWVSKLDLICALPRIQIICIKFPLYYVNGYHKELLPVMFRYLTLFDENVSVALFRDIDNVYTPQHQYFIDNWLDRGDDICLYMNEFYKRQEVVGLSDTGVIHAEKYYNTILSGLWNIKKPMGTVFSKTLWQKMFAYIEEYTKPTSNIKYINNPRYGTKFAYGFDELTLTRVLMPIFIEIGLTIYAIPTRIWDTDFFTNLLENSVLRKFIPRLSNKDTIKCIKYILIEKYWDMTSENAGLAQYVLCILVNIYFKIIIKQSKYFTDITLINNIKNKILPNTVLMGIGLFTFKNYKKYSVANANKVVDKFMLTGEKITLNEWTSNSILGDDCPGPHPPPDHYYI